MPSRGRIFGFGLFLDFDGLPRESNQPGTRTSKKLFQCQHPSCPGLKRTRRHQPTCEGTPARGHQETKMKAIDDLGQAETPDLIVN